MTILDTILAAKRQEVERLTTSDPLEAVMERARSMPPTRPFAEALRTGGIRVIAEIKKASPSRGVLVKEFDPALFAREYQGGGAAALSVLTERAYFLGTPEDLQSARQACGLPVLRKDFIVDPYQIHESRAMGADAILLIVKALNVHDLARFHRTASDIGLAVLVETHTAEEIETANAVGAEIIGINNRDLSTFHVSLERSLQLRERIRPSACAVSESGIHTAEHLRMLGVAGFSAALIGESLVTKPDRAEALRALLAGV